MNRLRLTATLVAVALIAAACSGSDTDFSTTSFPPTSTTGTVTSTTTASPSPTTTLPTTTATPSTTTAPPATTTLAGTPVDFGPTAGKVLAVVGVEFDDVLNVRRGPGVGEEIVATAAPTYAAFVAAGNTRQLPRSFWYEMNKDGTTGWVSAAFIGYLGEVDDATADVIAFHGETPSGDSDQTVIDAVVAAFASAEPASRVTTTVALTDGDLHEVTVDVIDLGDDAVLGFRLHIFIQVEDGIHGLKSVERTLLCTRGVLGGFCV